MIYVVPSRGRPHKALELIEAWRVTEAKAKLIFALDEDDPELVRYMDVIEGEELNYFVVPKGVAGGGMVGPLNYALGRLDINQSVGFMGDDHRPRTIGWDVKLRDAMRSRGALMAYGNDLMQGVNLPTAILMDGRVIDRLGYMAPPCLIHLYVDNYWKAIGTRTGTIIYVEDVVIEHMHPAAGKVEWDDDYRRVNAGSMYAADGAAFELLVQMGELDRDVAKIRELL